MAPARPDALILTVPVATLIGERNLGGIVVVTLAGVSRRRAGAQRAGVTACGNGHRHC